MLLALPLNQMETIFWKINQFFYNQFSLAVLDETAGRWIIKPESKNIPYLKAENANGRHILLKPDQNIEPYYLLVDDLNLISLKATTNQHQPILNMLKWLSKPPQATIRSGYTPIDR